MEEGLVLTPVTVIRPGDFLKRDKGLHDHVGVAWFDGRVLHNSPFRGEHLSSIEEFAAGRPVRVRPTAAVRREHVLANGMKVLRAPRGYHLWRNNCEHTAHYVVHGRPSSPQLWVWTLVAVAGAFVVLR